MTIMLHHVYRKQQGKQKEPSAKTLRSPLSADFFQSIACRVAALNAELFAVVP